MHIDRPSSIAIVPLKTARAQDTVIHTSIFSSWQRSGSVEFLWFWLLSIGFLLCSALELAKRDGTHSVVRHKRLNTWTKCTVAF